MFLVLFDDTRNASERREYVKFRVNSFPMWINLKFFSEAYCFLCPLDNKKTYLNILLMFVIDWNHLQKFHCRMFADAYYVVDVDNETGWA